jgi:hypothetical protein
MKNDDIFTCRKLYLTTLIATKLQHIKQTKLKKALFIKFLFRDPIFSRAA